MASSGFRDFSGLTSAAVTFSGMTSAFPKGKPLYKAQVPEATQSAAREALHKVWDNEAAKGEKVNSQKTVGSGAKKGWYVNHAQDKQAGAQTVGGSRSVHRSGNRAPLKQEDSELRKLISKVLESMAFEMAIAACLLVSVMLGWLETNASAAKESPDGWIEIATAILAVVYMLEIIARLYACGKDFFSDKMSIFELTIVVGDVALFLVDLSGSTDRSVVFILRLCRLVRTLRIVRLLSLFRPLYLIMQGFFAALESIIWATILLMVMVLLWSIMATNVLHPINEELENPDCERCQRAFASVEASFITLLQITLAGETFNSEISIPVIEQQPWTFVIFMSIHITVCLGIVNLVVAVIVDRANAARANNKENTLFEREESFRKAQVVLSRMAGDIDLNHDGKLTLTELLDGVARLPEFAAMLRLLEVGVDDMHILFNLLDTDKSGSVNYDEFVTELHKMKCEDSHSLLVFIKHHVLEVEEAICGRMEGEFEDLRQRLKFCSLPEEPSFESSHGSKMMAPQGVGIQVFQDAIGNLSSTQNQDVRPPAHEVSEPKLQEPRTRRLRASFTVPAVLEAHATEPQEPNGQATFVGVSDGGNQRTQKTSARSPRASANSESMDYTWETVKVFDNDARVSRQSETKEVLSSAICLGDPARPHGSPLTTRRKKKIRTLRAIPESTPRTSIGMPLSVLAQSTSGDSLQQPSQALSVQILSSSDGRSSQQSSQCLSAQGLSTCNESSHSGQCLLTQILSTSQELSQQPSERVRAETTLWDDLG